MGSFTMTGNDREMLDNLICGVALMANAGPPCQDREFDAEKWVASIHGIPAWPLDAPLR
jgi:hypothetical protein